MLQRRESRDLEVDLKATDKVADDAKSMFERFVIIACCIYAQYRPVVYLCSKLMTIFVFLLVSLRKRNRNMKKQRSARRIAISVSTILLDG